MEVIASAPAKIILFGEHFVLYGNPAILAAINRRISVRAVRNNNKSINIHSDGHFVTHILNSKNTHDSSTSFLSPILKCVLDILAEKRQDIGIDIMIESDIPFGEGLGSSAASCVATSAATYLLFGISSRDKICKKAALIESTIHKNSSGADCHVSTFGGIVYYNRKNGFRKIQSKRKFLFAVKTTGLKHATGIMVSQVKEFKDKKNSLFMNLASEAYSICIEAKKAFLKGDQTKLGRLMTANQKILSSIGVSHPEVDKIIDDCIKSGALGAKITGAGGGGAVIALFPNECKFLTTKKFDTEWSLVELDDHGVDSSFVKI
jgi:mevalonate kinase